MRVWSLIASLALLLAATGCVSLAELDGSGDLSRFLDEPPPLAEPTPVRANTEPGPEPEPVPVNPETTDHADLPGVPVPVAPAEVLISENVLARRDPPGAPVPDTSIEPERPAVRNDIPSVPAIPSDREDAPAAFDLNVPEPEPEPEALTDERSGPTTRFVSSTAVAVQPDALQPADPVDAIRPADLDLDRETIEELSQFVPRLSDDSPSQGRGPVVATVGDDTIRLPELTQAVRARIDRLPDGRKPNRREVIGMVQAEMESRVLESLARQHGRAILGNSGELDRVLAAIDRQWSEIELPRILRREGLRTPAEFDTLLADRGRSLDDLRTVFVTRTLGKELMRREGRADDDLDAYFDELRDRIPIDSALMRSPGRRRSAR